jgi:hypothetical protein
MFRPSPCTPWLVALALLLSAIPVQACSVPVFRYALEHWDAAPFRAFVFHRGPLTEAQQASVRELGKDGLAGRLHTNISVRAVDLDQDPPPEQLEVWRQARTETLPLLVVQFPASNRVRGTFWSGPLTAESAELLLDSPARKEIVQRLGEGQSAIWLLLESGDAAKDSAAAGLLEARLKHLASILELPKLDAQDIANGLVSTGQEGLRLEFSMLRLSHGDAREQALIHMLLGAEEDLAEAKGPIVVPVFGQGRALYALVGDGIKHETIDKSATFLIGKCSCEVKEQNPGFDLLLTADWKTLIKAQAAGIPDLPTMAELTKSAPVTVTISGSNPSAESDTKAGLENTPPRPRTVPIPLVLGLGFAALLAALLALRRAR